MSVKASTFYKLERIYKGIANHRRIQILFYIESHENASLDEIVKITKCNIKTIAEHVRRLVIAGLVNKHYHGKFVRHSLSLYGTKMLEHIKTFSHSLRSVR